MSASNGNSWQWVEGEGDGWAPEGNPIYKWAQYEKPPIPIGGATNPPTQGSVSVNMNAVTSHHEREPCEFTDMVKIIRLPLFGRIFLLKHVQGAIQASIVVSYWIYGSWSILSLLLLPHYREGHISVAPVLWYTLVSLLCICSFLRATSSNPGKIPIRENPEKPLPSDQLKNPQDQEFCFRCVQRRPPEAHHCSVCGQCVRKMDHHCPWINNCVGEDNRFLFVQLVLYAFLMSSSALVFLLADYLFLPKLEAVRSHHSDFIVICYILSSMMACGGGGLFFSQACMIRSDSTTLDFYRSFEHMHKSGKNVFMDGVISPEDMYEIWSNLTPEDFSRMPTSLTPKRSCRTAFNDHCGTRSVLCYFNPCRTRSPPPLLSRDQNIV